MSDVQLSEAAPAFKLRLGRLDMSVVETMIEYINRGDLASAREYVVALSPRGLVGIGQVLTDLADLLAVEVQQRILGDEEGK